MGICLDTGANATQETEDQNNDWNHINSGGVVTKRIIGSNTGSNMEIQNIGKIKFDPPKVPVIFVLGGPGSGKVTHCDTFIHERRGITHINMIDLLQQYALGNAMSDFSQLPSKTVTEVLMLEMKMAPVAKAYLISGYPRSMRDVVEYTEKIQVLNGVILISWRETILQKQIEYGAKLGHVVLSLARMELENFFKNSVPVAEYFDQSDMLIAVNGERSPAEVYKDFRSAILDILASLENQEAILNGVSGMGKGINDIPGSIVTVETAPSQETNITEHKRILSTSELQQDQLSNTFTSNIELNEVNGTNILTSNDEQKLFSINRTADISSNKEYIPPVIWVIGGPGSNKYMLCTKAVNLNTGWSHISIGRLLRNIIELGPRNNMENYAIKESLIEGELVSEKHINSLLHANMLEFSNKDGIIIDGYPRNMRQVEYFENKYKQQPFMILLDCSKLQFGRGRIDDSVSSFRRRLELFREQTLPMLKSLDMNNRLQIIDGDTENPTVQREFEKSIKYHVQKLKLKNDKSHLKDNGSIMDSNNETDAILHDLENNIPDTVPTISHHISLMNDHMKNRKHDFMNGDIRIGKNQDFHQTLREAEQQYPNDSYM